MRKYFQRTFALSEAGAGNLIRAILWTAALNLSFIIPAVLAFRFLDEYIQTLTGASAAPSHGIGYYVLLSAAAFVVMFFIAYFAYSATYVKIYEESAKRRISLAETLRKLPLAFFGKKDIADLSSTVMEDATQIEHLFSHSVPQIFAAALLLTIMAVLLFVYNWMLSLALFWVVPISAFVFIRSRRFQSAAHTRLYHLKRDISDTVQEGLDTVHEIKSYNREDDFNHTLSTKLRNCEKHMIRDELLIGAAVNVAYVILNLGLPSVILVGAYLLASGTINIFTYIIFVVLTTRIYHPIMEVMNNLAMVLYLGVRIKRMKEMDAMPRQEGSSDFQPKHYDITFQNVDFSYLDGVQTLRNVSFTAKQGEVTALVGPSGGGKSTVAKLSARFWDINGGKITLGGMDISKVDPETLLQSYSIVFQDVTLFNASVMDNIRLGRSGASNDEVIRAARQAQCDEFVQKLPQGYDTLIGENGERLSGGERQRISIARAMLKDAPIILLDEATASLDAENESKIQKALSLLTRNKTVLVIAHRMRTVAGADKIVVIKDGEIAEEGAPEELKERQGLFASLLNAQ